MLIELENIMYWGNAYYKKRWRIYPMINDFSYRFESGKAYHVVSGNDYKHNYDYNSQGLCWLIGGIIGQQKGTIYIDGQATGPSQRRNNFWLVRFDEIKRFGLFSQSLRKQIQHGIEQNPNGLTEDEIIQQFQLSEGRYNRLLRQFSTEGYRASCAVGFTNQKKIFCFPVLEERFILEYSDYWLKPLVQFLKGSDTVILFQFPAHVDTDGICDERVYVNSTIIPIRYIERKVDSDDYRIAGKDVTVQVLSKFIGDPAWTVERIAETYDLTLAEIYSAWAFYHDHQDEIDKHSRSSSR